MNNPNVNDSACLCPEDQDTGAKTREVTYRPAMDLYEFSDRYEVHFDVPGTAAEQVDITVDDGVLSVAARVAGRTGASAQGIHTEFGVGDYRRQVRLGEDIDQDALEASYAHGVLVVSLPKRTARQARRIEVNAG